jgi:hypothetical protein
MEWASIVRVWEQRGVYTSGTIRVSAGIVIDAGSHRYCCDWHQSPIVLHYCPPLLSIPGSSDSHQRLIPDSLGSPDKWSYRAWDKMYQSMGMGNYPKWETAAKPVLRRAMGSEG